MDNYTLEDLNAGRVLGISAVYDSVKDFKETGFMGQQRHTTVELSADIKPKTFVKVLEFLYSGNYSSIIMFYLKFQEEKEFCSFLKKVVNVSISSINFHNFIRIAKATG